MAKWRTAWLGACLAAGALCHVPAAARDAMLTVGEQTYHLETFGTKGPTVVFEAGQGNDIATWQRVAPEVATFAKVVLYDRAGLGRSLPMARKAPVTAAGVAAQLHALLAAAGLEPPYILVGHSLGGLYVQMYARTYPKDVSGVVLVEAASADAPDALTTRAQLAPGSTASFEEEGVAESNREVKAAGPFPNVPLIVIAATDHGPHFRSWEPTLMRLQRQLAALSPRGTLIVANDSGHDVQMDRAALVIDAVRQAASASSTAP